MDSRMRRAFGSGLIFAALMGLATLAIPGTPANHFHFSVLGDRTGGAAPEIYGRVWREMDLLHPDFIINVGDSIEGNHDTRAEADWEAPRAVWRRYARYPLYLVAGNHDIWSETSRALFEKQTGRKPFYSFDYEGAHFTVLDNSRTLELGEDQLRFLAQDLEANRTRAPKFVFFHKPFWIVYLKVGSGEFELHRLARKYGVAWVVSGHVHRFARMQRDGVVYLTVGSSGAAISSRSGREESFRQGLFYHHLWVTVKDGKAEVTVKELDGAAGQGRMFRAEDWENQGPLFDPEDPALRAQPET